MGQFKVYNSFPGEYTFVSNRFLDDYMPTCIFCGTAAAKVR